MQNSRSGSFAQKAQAQRFSHWIGCLALAWAIAAGAQPIPDAAPRALALGELPNDQRLRPLKDLDGYFPWTPSATLAEWQTRSAKVRFDLAVALGLWPMPDKTPLNAVIHGRIEQPDYTVEKVYFESLPGFFVTGNLYRPRGYDGKRPAILCPHGHWNDGRFLDAGLAEVRKEIARGEERFEEGGRSVLQSRCVQLARMGCVVFHYDMIGYADSVQIPQSLAHGFSRQRPEMKAAENWGLFSPQAEARLQSVMGLQTWDSIRALDFILSLPDVDTNRVGVTGASGGGTQTFILCALDDRPTVAFPAVMVSTAMQGGCTCENACLLRVDTGNVEIAALFAPKPLGMTAANDWTREMPAKGFPQLQQHFAMLGAPQNVELTALPQFGHNYNYLSRAAMYRWMNTHLHLGLPEPIVETNYHRLTAQELTVWDDRHPRPPGGTDFERKLLAYITTRDEEMLATCRSSNQRFHDVCGTALATIIGRDLTSAGKVQARFSHEKDRGGYFEKTGLLRNDTYGEEIPVCVLEPKEPTGRIAIWLDLQGKSSLLRPESDANLRARPAVQKLLDSKITVVGADLFLQGEFLPNGSPPTHVRKTSNPREAAAFTFGYNRALFAQRVDDILTLIQFAHSRRERDGSIALLGLNGSGPWAAAAAALARSTINCAAIDTRGFRFAQLADIYDLNFLPGAAKYGDLPGMLALCAPVPLWLTGEAAEPALVTAMYRQAAALPSLTLAQTSASEDAAVEWLLHH